MLGRTRAGSRTGASATTWTSLGKRALTCAAMARAKQVLPTLPGPARLRRRTAGHWRRRAVAATSCSRTMRGVRRSGDGEVAAMAVPETCVPDVPVASYHEQGGGGGTMVVVSHKRPFVQRDN